MTCGRTDCKELGKWRPVLLLRVHYKHPPGEAQIGILVCDAHKNEWSNAKDWITDDMWIKLVEGLTSVGKAEPVRVLTGLKYLRVA